ncbi:uncharacterized protein LOC124807063 [Hydra vulgaris]|uniref:uncharacterized protein LOC124807063 n=1 Tax=Hydra vulgaris TaxID=6087 RepID=UPI001F5E682D|nr:uncharacterized protein LOC124807063 isoform X1 [Hydra vulgaris]
MYKEKKRQKKCHEKMTTAKIDHEIHSNKLKSNKKMKYTDEEKKRKNAKSLNNTAITTKRLTVGVMGIFGNAKNSSSVYRDLMKRINKKKLSSSTSSEIKESLARIIQNCKLINSPSNSTPIGFVTPGNDSTKHSRCEISRVSSSTSSCDDVSEHSPAIPKTPYVNIAERMQSSLPQMKIFKDWDYLKDIKDQLQKIHNTKYPMDLAPKFHLKDNSDVSPTKITFIKNQDAQENKKIHSLHSRQLADITNIERNNLSNTLHKTCDNERHQADGFTKKKANIIEILVPESKHFERSGKVSCIPLLRSYPADDQSLAKSSVRCYHQDFFLSKNDDILLNEKSAFHLQPNTLLNNQCLYNLRCSDMMVGKNKHIDNRNQPQNSALQILNQPINSLRRNRRPTNQTLELAHSNEEVADILDYIDSIPIKVLESELLGRNENVTSSLFDTELVKPSLESPSPPKYYRMSMF